MKIFLEKKLLNNTDKELCKSFFNKKYLEKIGKNTFFESVFSRFLISKIVEKEFFIKNYEPKVDLEGKPCFENDFYWSISHKNGLVFVGVSEKKIGLDIEIIKKRDESLLDFFSFDFYDMIGGKNWENFYILWTSIESIIKIGYLKIENLKDLKLLKIENKLNKIGNISFNKELYFEDEKEKYRVFSLVENEEVLGVCFILSC